LIVAGDKRQRSSPAQQASAAGDIGALLENYQAAAAQPNIARLVENAPQSFDDSKLG
jgi:hypothetical protein